MRRKSFLLAAAAIAVAASFLASCSKPENKPEVQKHVLTFEGEYFDKLIDSQQYGGPLLYSEDSYKWNFNFLSHECVKADWSGWGGAIPWGWDSGAAISNYTMDGYGTYTEQLAVKTSEKNGGHNGSANFGVWYGYLNGYNTLPEFKFPTDVNAKLQEVYITNTAYALGNCFDEHDNCIILDDQEVYAEITVTLLSGATKSSRFYLVKGKDIVTDWTRWDLSSLCADESVVSFNFNVGGNIANEWGFSFPGYFAFDDLAFTYLILGE